MNISLKILETQEQITKEILRNLLPQVTDYMDNSINIIKKELPEIIKLSILKSPEYDSILSGSLKYEFGIIDSSSKLNGLIEIWTKNIVTTYNKPSISGSQIKSKFSIQMIKADYSDVLGTDYATMVDTERGYSLPWLKWLLLDGNQIIIDNSSIVFGSNNFSRTGYAIMAPGGSWRVPSFFSGTVDDNWITRSIVGASSEINDLLNKAFKI